MRKKILLLLAFLVFVGISCYADDPVNELLYDYQSILTLSGRVSFNSGDVYNLQQDIDMSGHPLLHSIGYSGPFLGTFIGNGHTITNLTYISTNDYIGLFSKNEGTITNLVVDHAKITGHNYVGGLVAQNQGNIDNCKFTDGDITGNDYVGGLVGYNYNGTIQSSSSSGDVTGNDQTGGLIGYSYSSTSSLKVQTSSSSCNVTGHNYVGGLIGYYRGSDIEKCYYRGLSSCDDQFLLNVIGNNAVGGLIGNFGTCLEVKNIKNCYALGNIKGSSNCGGLVGIMYGATIEECYSFCDFEVTNPPSTTTGNFIGMIGSSLSIEKFSYYKVNTLFPEIGDPSQVDFAYLCSLTPTQLKTQNSYTNWNFTATWHINALTNDGYPYLLALPTPCDLVDEQWAPKDIDGDGYYDITNSCELHWVDENPKCWNWNFELNFPNNELDCSGKTGTWNSNLGFLPIGRDGYSCFQGNFYGNNNKIKNLVISTNHHAAGFFGCVHGIRDANDGQVIKDITLENLQVIGTIISGSSKGSLNFVGGLIGHFWDGGDQETFQRYGFNKIQNCKIINSSISCTTDQYTKDHYYLYIGGLVGCVDNGAQIENCSVNSTTVTGIGAVGGLAGYTQATLIKDCFTTFCDLSTSKDSAIGGLIGVCDAYTTSTHNCSIEQCFTNNDIVHNHGNKIGGLVGSLTPYLTKTQDQPDGVASNTKYVSIKNCYSRGSINVTYGNYLGGLIGRVNKGCNGNTQSYISQSYSACTVVGNSYIGGFIGAVAGTPDQIKCFWDAEIGPLTSAGNAAGTSTSLMNIQETYCTSNFDPDWDFGRGNNPPIWGITPEGTSSRNARYPYLVALNDAQPKISIFASNYLSGHEISIFPNPVLNFSTLEIIMKNEDLIDISMYNVLGTKVSTIYLGKALEGSNYYNLDTSQLNSGSYYIILKTSKDIISKTVIVNK